MHPFIIIIIMSFELQITCIDFAKIIYVQNLEREYNGCSTVKQKRVGCSWKTEEKTGKTGRQFRHSKILKQVANEEGNILKSRYYSD